MNYQNIQTLSFNVLAVALLALPPDCDDFPSFTELNPTHPMVVKMEKAVARVMEMEKNAVASGSGTVKKEKGVVVKKEKGVVVKKEKK